MRQIRDFADERNKEWCVYCGGQNETRDHVPSRVFLDEPLPENLPVVPACIACNSSFSRDEEYLACLIECGLAGSVEAASARGKIAGIFARSPALASRMRAARTEMEQGVRFTVENDRVRNVIVKLARAHVAFEQNEPQLDDPCEMSLAPFTAISDEHRAQFEALPTNAFLPEVGSRGLIRLFEGHDLGADGWIDVQPGRYRYRVLCDGSYRVQIVFREYLAAEVAWD